MTLRGYYTSINLVFHDSHDCNANNNDYVENGFDNFAPAVIVTAGITPTHK